jgi:toxin-antitoxin system PIN domain toxin
MSFSLDTNILLYAANRDCAEHEDCLAVMKEAAAAPDDWVLADQVLFELYKALRNPKILRRPLTAPAAFAHVEKLRDSFGFIRCWYEAACWPQVAAKLRQNGFPYQRTHDAVLSATLRHHGVRIFYTRNTKDFQDAGFEKVIDPVSARRSRAG